MKTLFMKLFFAAEKNAARFLFIISLSLVIAGCAAGGKPPYSVDSYLLNYESPSSDGFGKLDATAKFSRFTVASAYNSTQMIFRTDRFGFDAFNYSRWAVNPADMVADGLLRDIRGSGVFLAVFSRNDAEDGRFLISGNIEEFFLHADEGMKAAVVSVTVSLRDTQEKETGKKFVFQNKYRMEQSLNDVSPRGYSQAASEAMRIISRQIINDIYAVAHDKLQAQMDEP